jgi:hypothetical protein
MKVTENTKANMLSKKPGYKKNQKTKDFFIF